MVEVKDFVLSKEEIKNIQDSFPGLKWGEIVRRIYPHEESADTTLVFNGTELVRLDDWDEHERLPSGFHVLSPHPETGVTVPLRYWETDYENGTIVGKLVRLEHSRHGAEMTRNLRTEVVDGHFLIRSHFTVEGVIYHIIVENKMEGFDRKGYPKSNQVLSEFLKVTRELWSRNEEEYVCNDEKEEAILYSTEPESGEYPGLARERCIFLMNLTWCGLE